MAGCTVSLSLSTAGSSQFYDSFLSNTRSLDERTSTCSFDLRCSQNHYLKHSFWRFSLGVWVVLKGLEIEGWSLRDHLLDDATVMCGTVCSLLLWLSIGCLLIL